jgi:hypothetical protein
MEKIHFHDIVKMPNGKISSFRVLGNGLIEINKRMISFDDEWNKNRHILGIMATIDVRVRMSDRRN